MKLNYRICNPISIKKNNNPIFLLHGLFGNLDNLNIIGRYLNEDRTIIKVDMRNHGLSPHSTKMDYEEMAKDIVELIYDLNIDYFDIIGHSMGGKAAMKLTEYIPNKINLIAILDIAPVHYECSIIDHEKIFISLNEVLKYKEIKSRHEAAKIMRNFLNEERIIQFLLKSFNNGKWLFNLETLINKYNNIRSWKSISSSYKKKIIFIKGELSDYIHKKYYFDIIKQFPNSIIQIVPNVTHWLHIENPIFVTNILRKFLDFNNKII